MAATISRGYSFAATEQVTAAKLHSLVDSATISGISNSEIADNTIQDGKIYSVSGSKFVTLSGIPAGAGDIPKANLDGDWDTDGTLAANSDLKLATQKATKTYADGKAAKGANSDITSLAGLTTPLSAAQGGTGATANANAASGVVVLDANSKLPAVDGSQLTGIVTPTQVNDTDAGTLFRLETTFLTKDKTITSGNTVLLIASGYILTGSDTSQITIKLKNGSTVSQTIIISTLEGENYPWSCCGIVTGLSGSTTFSVTATADFGDQNATAYGNLVVIEF